MKFTNKPWLNVIYRYNSFNTFYIPIALDIKNTFLKKLNGY